MEELFQVDIAIHFAAHTVGHAVDDLRAVLRGIDMDAEWARAFYALYSRTRQLTPRVRVFIEWMAEQFRERLYTTAG